MSRLDNWNSNLFNLIAVKRDEEFKYGTNDCTLFGADIVQAITGVDLASEFRGTYKTLRGGLKKLKAAGYADHVDYLDKNLVPVEIAFAQAGDIGVVEIGDIKSICLIMGRNAYALSEKEGLVLIGLDKVERAFRV